MNSKLREIFAEYYHRWVKYGYYGNPEKLDQDTEFNQFDEAIRKVVAEDMLELLPSQSKYKTVDSYKKAVRQKIKDWSQS